MFSCKEIDASATPDSVRQRNDMVKKFGSRVFAAHFRKTKAKYGLFAATGESVSFEIPELSESTSGSTTQQQPSVSSYDDRIEKLQLVNSPFCTWTYTDHTAKCDFVCVVVPIISGIRDMTPQLSEDGLQLIVRYTWPSSVYNAEELFYDKIKNKQITMQHPKIHAFMSHLLDCGITGGSKPEGEMLINLPCKVKREIGSWQSERIKFNDTKMLLFQFTAYQKDFIIQAANTCINFD